MKVISLWQPWAQLWVLGEKVFETRHWYTKYRGPLLVHAAKTKRGMGSISGICSEDHIEKALARHGFNEDNLPLGAIIGKVDLIGCCSTNDVQPVNANETHFGDWGPGRFCWEAANPQCFAVPVPCKGQRGFWNVEWPAGEAQKGETP